MLFTKQTLSIHDTGLFSDVFNDYINRSKNLTPFYTFHNTEQDFAAYFQQTNFDDVNRAVLVEALHQQANSVANTSTLSKQHIDKLKHPATYTVTTGHQLCLFTGPLYFIYKIISAINVCNVLRETFPDKEFVPVYWMASEDHDVEEINHAYVFGKKLTWNTKQTGSVGEFSTEGIREVINELKVILGNHEQATRAIQLMEEAYAPHHQLAEATRYLVNALFGGYGLVVLDGNDAALKSLFKAEFKKDVFDQTSYQAVSKTVGELKQHYAIQVNPRHINVFYKEPGLRERIEKDGDEYRVVNTGIRFSKPELEHLIDTRPETLSPNVVLRPLYQQKILPNIAYVGGPGEIAYWLEYQGLFQAYGIPFPVLVPRQFVLLLDKGTQAKCQKLSITVPDVFKEGEELVKRWIKARHTDVHLDAMKVQLTEAYTAVLKIITPIDKSLIGAVEAEKQKAMNGWQTMEQKINRALKQQSETEVNQIWKLKEKLFPKGIPQERHDNVLMYSSKYGQAFIKELMEQLAYDLQTSTYTVLVEY